MLNPHVVSCETSFLWTLAISSSTVSLVPCNLELLHDVEIMLSSVCLILMLEMVNALVNFAQLCDVFVCDVVMIINENMPRWSQQTLWIILIMICFKGSMCGLVEINHEIFSMEWITYIFKYKDWPLGIWV